MELNNLIRGLENRPDFFNFLIKHQVQAEKIATYCRNVALFAATATVVFLGTKAIGLLVVEGIVAIISMVALRFFNFLKNSVDNPADLSKDRSSKGRKVIVPGLDLSRASKTEQESKATFASSSTKLIDLRTQKFKELPPPPVFKIVRIPREEERKTTAEELENRQNYGGWITDQNSDNALSLPRNFNPQFLTYEPTRVKTKFEDKDAFYDANYLFAGRVIAMKGLSSGAKRFWAACKDAPLLISLRESFFIDDAEKSKPKTISLNNGHKWFQYNVTVFDGQKKDHFHFADWPDHGIVKPEVILEMIKQIDVYMKAHPGKPFVVYCEQGIGRTAVLTISWALIQSLIEAKGKLKSYTESQITDLVFRVASSAKRDRPKFFSNEAEEQYLVLHDVVKAYLASEQIPVTDD